AGALRRAPPPRAGLTLDSRRGGRVAHLLQEGRPRRLAALAPSRASAPGVGKARLARSGAGLGGPTDRRPRHARRAGPRGGVLLRLSPALPRGRLLSEGRGGAL